MVRLSYVVLSEALIKWLHHVHSCLYHGPQANACAACNGRINGWKRGKRVDRRSMPSYLNQISTVSHACHYPSFLRLFSSIRHVSLPAITDMGLGQKHTLCTSKGDLLRLLRLPSMLSPVIWILEAFLTQLQDIG